MLVDMLKVLADKKRIPQQDYDLALKRMIRHSEFSERIISPKVLILPTADRLLTEQLLFKHWHR